MDSEVWKVAITVFSACLGVPVALKVWLELKTSRRARRQSDSEFAFKISEVLDDPVLRRYGEEVAYAAVVGDDHLSHAQRKYLVSVPNAERVVGLYSFCRVLVDPRPEEHHIAWKYKRHQKKGYRLLLKGTYFCCYVASCSMMFAPSIATAFSGTKAEITFGVIALHAYFFLVFGALAILALRAGTRVSRAEELIETTARVGEPAGPEKELPGSAKGESDGAAAGKPAGTDETEQRVPTHA